MAITDYKPIDDQTANPNGDFSQQNLPLSSALANRYANNNQYCVQNRLIKHAKTYDGARTTKVTANAEIEGQDLLGYTGNFGGVAGVEVPYTKGLQFSTHPSGPLCIPFLIDIRPGARFIDVRVAAVVENEAGGMMAFARSGATDIIHGLQPYTGFNNQTYNPISGFFIPEIRATTQYQLAGLTASTGYNGMSYFQMTIPIATKDFGTPLELPNGDQKDVVFLVFQSGIDVTSPAVNTITSNPSTGFSIEGGNRRVFTNENFQKYSGNLDPGALHEVAVFQPKGLEYSESVHHVLGTQPSNPSLSAYDISQSEILILSPSILPGRVGVGTSADAERTAGTGIETGDTFTRYPITKFSLYSVSIQQRYS